MSRRETAFGWVAVAIGGAAGTGLRLALDTALPHPLDGWAWSTLIANTVGAFALGWMAAALWHRVPGWLRSGLGAGLLGSFTTWSALMVSAVAIAQGGGYAGEPDSLLPGDPGTAALELVVGLAAGLAAAWIGLALGARRPESGGEPVAAAVAEGLDEEEDA